MREPLYYNLEIQMKNAISVLKELAVRIRHVQNKDLQRRMWLPQRRAPDKMTEENLRRDGRVGVYLEKRIPIESH